MLLIFSIYYGPRYRKKVYLKQANILEEFFTNKPESFKIQCPICNTDPHCLLCGGVGELIPIAQNDEEDQRVIKELDLEKE